MSQAEYSSEIYRRIDSLLARARELLVSARIARQKATAISEWATINPGGPPEEGRILYKEAESLRKMARNRLIEIEKLNGKLFVWGLPCCPLEDFLTGKSFRKWRQYQQLYSMNFMFKGVDPE